MAKCLSQKEYLLKIPTDHKNKYDLSLIKYKNLRSKIRIICKKHGAFTIGAKLQTFFTNRKLIIFLCIQKYYIFFRYFKS